jgi:hypothetical protein
VSGQLSVAAGLIAVVVAIAALAALGVALVLRRVLISHRGGVVECALRLSPAGPWRHGMAEYRGAQLNWHRAMSLRLRPHAAFDRSQLAVLSSRKATPEEVQLGPGTVVVECQAVVKHRGHAPDRRVVELAMSHDALMGLLSWLEASPIYPIRRVSLPAGAPG